MFCLEPPYKGPGNAVLPRFFFNTRSGFCEAFVFGGGKAKLNNFLTKDECSSVCSGRKPAFQTQYKLKLQAQPELKDEPVDKTQGPACRNLEPENQDEDEKPEDEKPEDEKPEDEDSDLKEDDEDEDEVNDEDDGNEEPQD